MRRRVHGFKKKKLTDFLAKKMAEFWKFLRTDFKFGFSVENYILGVLFSFRAGFLKIIICLTLFPLPSCSNKVM